MFDQSFSSSNFQTIFNIENRKGHIVLGRMSQDYQEVVADMRETKKEMSALRKKKRDQWSEAEVKDDCNNKGLLELLQKERNNYFISHLEQISKTVNAHDFQFSMTKSIYNGKEVFSIDTTVWAQFYAMKCLSHNLMRVFNIETSNRHTVMTNLKLLMNNYLPVYVIRTDVSHFFESIPQKRLMDLVDRNSVLSMKSKEMIHKIIKQYEQLKDQTLVPANIGVPRGIGVSSVLSEIYMNDIDKEIKSRQEVIFYSRYVDDIIILLSDLGHFDTIEAYYTQLKSRFLDEYGLTLQSLGSTKCKLLKLHEPGGGTRGETLSYLGYKMYIQPSNRFRSTMFGLSDERKLRFKTRVDHVVNRFNNVVKVNIRQAKHDLKDGLNLITGNIRLSKAKSGVKVGFYYNNDLLDRNEDFHELQDYLNQVVISVPANLFLDSRDKMRFESKMQSYIGSISLKDRWMERKTYDIGYNRLREIAQWL